MAGISRAAIAERPGRYILTGNVTDARTGHPIASCRVQLVNTSRIVLSDDSGHFRFPDLTDSTVAVLCERIGYQSTQSEVVHLSARGEVSLTVALAEEVVEMGPLLSFGERRTGVSSLIPTAQLDSRSIRNDAGSIGDIGRALQVLPSTSRVTDNSSDLPVRGGSPVENGFYVDGIAVPNINHFPIQGSTAGAVAMFSDDLVADAALQPGGFAAPYGDAASSVISLNLREGSRQRFNGAAAADLMDTYSRFDGPIDHGRGSWLVAARRSHLDLLVDVLETYQTPRFTDSHAKVVYDFGPRHTVSVLNLFGHSSIALPREKAIDGDYNNYGRYAGWQNVTGLAWRWLYGARGATNTSVAFTRQGTDLRWNWTWNEKEYYRSISDDSQVRLRNVSTVRLSERHTLEVGFDLGRIRNRTHFIVDNYYTDDGENITRSSWSRQLWTTKFGLFVSDVWSVTPRLALSLGVRADQQSGWDHLLASPRASARYAVAPNLDIGVGVGLYRQGLPAFVLVQEEPGHRLRPMNAWHYTTSLAWTPSGPVSLSLSGYEKRYTHFPLENERPWLFVIDDGTSLETFGRYYDLRDDGQGKAHGVEALITLGRGKAFSGVLSGSLSRTLYRDLNGIWHSRVFDTRRSFQASTSYQPSKDWRFGLRWIVCGGTPYTPFDSVKSAYNYGAILDTTQVNAARMPLYHTLHLLIEKRWAVAGTVLATYLNVHNVYNRKNISRYLWDFGEDRTDAEFQWGFMPILGMRWEFY